MTVVVGSLNGTNIVEDYQRNSIYDVAGAGDWYVFEGFSVLRKRPDEATYIVGAGSGIIKVTRGNQSFFVDVHNTGDITLEEVPANSKIFIRIKQANVDDGSENPIDGTGVAELEIGNSYPSGNCLHIASIGADGNVTDDRIILRKNEDLALQTDMEEQQACSADYCCRIRDLELTLAEKGDVSLLDILLVGGGGSSGVSTGGGGTECGGYEAPGGGGEVSQYDTVPFLTTNINVVVGCGGAYKYVCDTTQHYAGCNGGSSCFGFLEARGGQGGPTAYGSMVTADNCQCCVVLPTDNKKCSSGAGVFNACLCYCYISGSTLCSGMADVRVSAPYTRTNKRGYPGGETMGATGSFNCTEGGGTAGPGGPKCSIAANAGYSINVEDTPVFCMQRCCVCTVCLVPYGLGNCKKVSFGHINCCLGQGGKVDFSSGLSNSCHYYCSRNSIPAPICTAGTGCGGNATCHCSSYCRSNGEGGSGYVSVRYPADGKYGIRYATGGHIYLCDGYMYHERYKNGTFCILKQRPEGTYTISYLAVGGGGSGGCWGGGGGGEVIISSAETQDKSISITIGKGGCTCTTTPVGGGFTCIKGIACARGGCAGSSANGGASGSGCAGGVGYTCGGGGGGGAFQCGMSAPNCSYSGIPGKGYQNYGAGGSGRGCNYSQCYNSPWGGGCAGSCCNASCYGGGGGAHHYCGASNTCPTYKFGTGCQGLVEICYPANGSFGFTCATGGTKSLRGEMCVHTFTANGTFTIVS